MYFWKEYFENITHHQSSCKICIFFCCVSTVDQEEHPHVVCQRRRRRPRSSASQGGVNGEHCPVWRSVCDSWEVCSLQGEGGAVMTGWNTGWVQTSSASSGQTLSSTPSSNNTKVRYYIHSQLPVVRLQRCKTCFESQELCLLVLD